MSSCGTLMDVDQVAEALRVSPHTVRRWAGQKKLRRIKLGSRTLFDPVEVTEFIEQAKRASASLAREDGVLAPERESR